MPRKKATVAKSRISVAKVKVPARRGRPPAKSKAPARGRPPGKAKTAAAKAKSKVKSEKVVESISEYISFSDVAIGLARQKIKVSGYTLTKMNRAKHTIGNAVVIARFLDSHNASAAKPIAWGEIVGYGGGARKIKCVKRSSVSELTKEIRQWAGKVVGAAKAGRGRKKYKNFSDFSHI